MTDIVERIRNLCTHDDGPEPAGRLLDEAADEIERLRAEVERLAPKRDLDAERSPEALEWRRLRRTGL